MGLVDVMLENQALQQLPMVVLDAIENMLKAYNKDLNAFGELVNMVNQRVGSQLAQMMSSDYQNTADKIRTITDMINNTLRK